MSYYGVSVLITILVTSLIAFYLLYKAKELNLGILISISIGSIILGFTFSPAFKMVLNLLSVNININKKVALVIALLTVLFVFLLFILVISFIISICIPKSLTSIDCCIVIDRIISKIKDGMIGIKDNLTGFSKKIIINLKKIVENVYNLKNKLKKPVDTKQIIDTMGIEKSENGISKDEIIKDSETEDNVPFANLLAFMEPSSDVAYANQDHSSEVNNIAQELDIVIDDTYLDLVEETFEEVVTTNLSYDEIEEVDNIDESELNDFTEVIAEIEPADVVVENEIEQFEAVETEAVDSVVILSDVIEEEASEVELERMLPIEPIDANSLVLRAFESKDEGKKEEAIELYIEALQHGPNNEMIFWIVLDICALYKQLGLSELAKNILEGLVNEYGAVIQPEIKMEIMNNLK